MADSMPVQVTYKPPNYPLHQKSTSIIIQLTGSEWICMKYNAQGKNLLLSNNLG